MLTVSLSHSWKSETPWMKRHLDIAEDVNAAAPRNHGYIPVHTDHNSPFVHVALWVAGCWEGEMGCSPCLLDSSAVCAVYVRT